MKKMLRRLSIALMMLVFTMSLAACSNENTDDSVVDPAIVASMEESCVSIIEVLPELTDTEIEAYLESGDPLSVSATNAWLDNCDDLGAFIEIIGSNVIEEEKNYVLTSEIEFEKNNATVIMNFDSTGTPTYMSMEVNYSFGESMRQAALNTLMGIGTVFVVLAFLIVIISSLKYVGKAFDGGKKSPAPAPKAPAAPAVPVVPVVEEELVDDGELVAVIAAAIAAAENTSTDSFVVRSIRRKPNNKWSRA